LANTFFMRTPERSFLAQLIFLVLLTTVGALQPVLPLPCFQAPSAKLRCGDWDDCQIGSLVDTSCQVLPEFRCSGPRVFNRTFSCMYCFLTHPSNYTCASEECQSGSQVFATCKMNEAVLCLGNREFPKRVTCNFTTGYNWSTAFILSILLGGFGVDRFYLGHTGWAVFKLVSFGGLGVWTFIDFVLIAIGYL